jgi:hypothetical protein
MTRIINIKKIFLCIGLLVSFCAVAFAQNILLSSDAKDAQKLPKNFRMFADTKLSGSAQFSEGNLQLMKKTIPADKITIVDLRQESHGLVNGIAVSWYAARNEINKGKGLPEIVTDEQGRLNSLLQTSEVVIATKTKKNPDTGEQFATETKTIKAERVATEEQLVQSMGFNYFRLPVPDHRRPTNSDVDQFIAFFKALPPDTWVHFHCKAGRGRTTTFMVMYDMMKNAKTTSMENILARHAEAGGIDFNAEYKDWRQQAAEERTAFIKDFYQYCQANNDGYSTSWSAWVASK